jgi:hypothetical protein
LNQGGNVKRLPVLLCCLLALSACANLPGWWPGKPEPVAVVAKKAAPLVDKDGRPLVMVDGVAIERIEFKAGVSSVTVEKMGREAGCAGGLGAGLMTPSGPVEIYRMACEDGKTFKARCELRQCKAM